MLIDKRTTTSVSAVAKQQHKLHFRSAAIEHAMIFPKITLFHFIIAKLKTWRLWRNASPACRTPLRISWGRIFNYLSKSVHSPPRGNCANFSSSFLLRSGDYQQLPGHWQASIKCISLQLHVDNIITLLLLLFRLLLLLL